MQEKKRGRTHSRWLLPAALVLAGAAWFENFTLSTSTVTAACAALPEAASGCAFCPVSFPACRILQLLDCRYFITSGLQRKAKQRACALEPPVPYEKSALCAVGIHILYCDIRFEML